MTGQGLLTADGPLWRDQRRIVAASFAPAAVDALAPTFVRAAEAAMAQWGEGGRIDMAAASTGTTMRVIADSLFAGDPRLTSGAALAHIAGALEAFSEARLQVLLGLPVMSWSRKGWRGRKGRIYLRATLAEVVRDRLRGDRGSDFLADRSARGALRPGAGGGAGGGQRGDLLPCRSRHHRQCADMYPLPAVGAVGAAGGSGSGSEGGAGRRAEDLPGRLPLTRRFLDGSLRLYPPVPHFDRQALGPHRLDGHDSRRAT